MARPHVGWSFSNGRLWSTTRPFAAEDAPAACGDFDSMTENQRDVMEYEVAIVGRRSRRTRLRDPTEAAETRLEHLRAGEGGEPRRTFPVRRGPRTGTAR